MNHYIYSLIDPRYNTLRYIGQTNNVKDRLRRHLQDNRKLKRTSWIKSLINKNLKPIMRIEAVVTFKDKDKMEKMFIQSYKSMGCKLLNMTEGGEGGDVFKNKTPKELKKYKKKLSKAKLGKAPWNKGKKMSKEFKDKCKNKNFIRNSRGQIIGVK